MSTPVFTIFAVSRRSLTPACAGLAAAVLAMLLGCVPANGSAPADSGAGSAQVQSIHRALVSADGRTITVPATGGGCITSIDLSATESATQVELLLTAHVNQSQGTACPDDAVLTQESTVLAQPLGTRRLVDQSTGKTVPYIPGRELAVPRWLPTGASKPANRVMNGWTRTYTFPKSSGLAPLEIIENPGHFADPQQFSDSQSPATKVKVDGATAKLVVQRDSAGRPESAFVGWKMRGYAIIVSSEPWLADQHPLSRRNLLRVARSLRVPPALR